LLHEWMHFVFALLFRIPVVSVKIGSDWPQLKIGKWRISPFLGLSYVTTEYEPVAALCFYKKLLYFSSGIGMNALLALLFFFLYCGMTRYIFLLAAISNVVINVVLDDRNSNEKRRRSSPKRVDRRLCFRRNLR
ncbi:MAG: hypothetical protein J5878_01685, partial [Oscillospiraceae bacterium]|nr:hypothetical protein [Oscillospiraceae bacterium]